MRNFGGISYRLIMTIKTLAVGLLIVLPFQNCGTEYSSGSSSLFTEGSNSRDCLSELVDCGPNSEYLEITLDMQNPTPVILPLVTSPVLVDIAGRCNTGNYPEHNIRLKVYSPTGTLLLQRDKYMACVQGRFTFLEDLTGGVQTNAINTLEAEMVGISEGVASVNFLSTGRANADLSVQVVP